MRHSNFLPAVLAALGHATIALTIPAGCVSDEPTPLASEPDAEAGDAARFDEHPPPDAPAERAQDPESTPDAKDSASEADQNNTPPTEAGGEAEVLTPPIQDARADGPVPAHRATAVCPAERGAGIALNGCDANCSATGVNGRCTDVHQPSGNVSRCTYDACSTDTDCAAGLACVCRTSGQDPAANYCAPSGNCRQDSDCGPPGYCSFSFDRVCPSAPSWGYFCHTPQDECVVDSECPGSSCIFDSTRHRWTCSKSMGCPDA